MLINTHLHRSILKIVETIKAFYFMKSFYFTTDYSSITPVFILKGSKMSLWQRFHGF